MEAVIDRRVRISPGPLHETMWLSGYAAGFEPYYWPPSGWAEEIPRETFEWALGRRAEQHSGLLAIECEPSINLVTSWHVSSSVAWNRIPVMQKGSLQIDLDDVGLKIRALVSTPLAQWARSATLAISFRVLEDEFSINYRHRRIKIMHLDDILIAHEPPLSIYAQVFIPP